jgi:hypothetical protein
MVMNRLARMAGVLLVICCGALPLPAWAALQAYVDRNPVAEHESFTLTLESDGEIDGSPDLSPLQQDFAVQGQGKSSSLMIVNGAVTRKTRWQIRLIAKRGGQLQIPSIGVGGERSQALTVTVAPASQIPSSPAGGDLFLEVSAAPLTVYVQQQVIYTVRLYRAVNLANGSTLSEPALPGGDAVVEKLGQDKEFATLRNGMRYEVIERNYAINPQKSGGLDIAPLVFDGDIIQGNPGGGIFGFGPFNQSTRHKRLRSQAEHITVNPIPASFRGGQWLPARSLQLMETWSPNPPDFVVGQAVTRTVAAMADGLTASQLPVLDGGAVGGLKRYPDQPSLKDTQGNAGVTGVRTEKIAYIPTQAGSVTLPVIMIPWWNTVTDRMEVATLPAQSFTVLPAPAGGGASPPLPAGSATPQPGAPAVVASRPALPQPGSDRWPWIALLLGSGWLATLFAWWWRTRRVAARRESRASEEDGSLHRLEKSLRASCLANDAVAAKGAVLAWARRRWPEHPPISLIAVARRCAAPVSEALLELDRSLYGQTAATWQGQGLWRQFAAHRIGKKDKAGSKDDGLDPLYRSADN